MTVRIQCPACGRELKLPDRKLLGRKGKCPKCGHSFVLAEEIPPAAPQAAPTDSAEAARPSSDDSSNPVQEFSFRSLLEPSGPLTEPSFAQAISPGNRPLGFDELQRRRLSRQRMILSSIFGGLAILIVIALIIAKSGTVSVDRPPVDASATTNPKDPVEHVPQEQSSNAVETYDAGLTEYAKLDAPTEGAPVDLKWMPFGVQIVLHFHPAAIWDDQLTHGELLACLPELSRWMEEALRELLLTEPKSIEEITLAIIPGVRGAPPDVAAVARLTSQSELDHIVAKLGTGETEGRFTKYEHGGRAFLVIDSLTIAVCQKSQFDEVKLASDRAHPSDLLDPLLPITDRDRQLTVVLTPATLGLHDTWLSPRVQSFVNAARDWLGENVESLGFSLHSTEQQFRTEILLHSRKTNSRKLQQQFQADLEQLAGRLVPLIQQMKPDQTGKRTLIGRFPAMMEVFSMSSILRCGKNYVQVTTPLPGRAGSNLLLAGYLAWDESTRTSFSADFVSPAGPENVPKSVVERLQKIVDIDFRAVPLSEAFEILSDETGVSFELDGEALKAGGFTKNLKQSFQMSAVPAAVVITKLFAESKSEDSNPQKKLVIVVNEVKQTILVTTLAVANQQRLTPYNLPQ